MYFHTLGESSAILDLELEVWWDRVCGCGEGDNSIDGLPKSFIFALNCLISTQIIFKSNKLKIRYCHLEEGMLGLVSPSTPLPSIQLFNNEWATTKINNVNK